MSAQAAHLGVRRVLLINCSCFGDWPATGEGEPGVVADDWDMLEVVVV